MPPAFCIILVLYAAVGTNGKSSQPEVFYRKGVAEYLQTSASVIRDVFFEHLSVNESYSLKYHV